MKISLRKILIALPILGISLGSCSGLSKSIKVTLNLDLLTLKEDDKAFPTSLTGDELKMMIESKQDFVLFFHQRDCSVCKKVIPYYDQLLNPNIDKKNGYVPLNIYSFSADSSDFTYIQSIYPNLFDQTPKTMIFKGGQNILTLAPSRYKSYKTFESAINEMVIPSNIYTAKKDISISKFIEKAVNNPYLIFIRTTDKDIDNRFLSYEYWSNHAYPILKDSDVPTLLLTYDLLEDDAKKTINKAYGLDNKTTAVYVNGSTYSKYNYLEKPSSDKFISLLNEKF